MAFTTAGSTNILRQLIGKVSNGILTNCYMALSTTTPNADGTNFTEPSATTGYARTVIGLYNQSATQVMNDPVNGTTSNKDIIFFPEASATWGTITYFGLYTAATGGQLILYGALSSPITVAANYVPLFRAGNFSLTLA